MLNGAVLMFDQGSPFIHECMVRRSASSMPSSHRLTVQNGTGVGRLREVLVVFEHAFSFPPG